MITKTSRNSKVNLVVELKGTKYLKEQKKELNLLREKFEKIKSELDNTDLQNSIQFLKSKGMSLDTSKEKIFISEYEMIKQSIIQKEESLSNPFFKIIPDVVFDLANKYDMRFLPLSEYTGEIDINLASKIQDFEKTIDYDQSKTFYFILAPTEMFNKTYNITKVVTHEVILDPVVIAIKGETNLINRNGNVNSQIKSYIDMLIDPDKTELAIQKMVEFLKSPNTQLNFIHKWGDDFTETRKIKTFFNKFIPNVNIIVFTTIFLILSVGCPYIWNMGETSLLALFNKWYVITPLALIGVIYLFETVDNFINKYKVLLPKNKTKVNVEHVTVYR